MQSKAKRQTIPKISLSWEKNYHFLALDAVLKIDNSMLIITKTNFCVRASWQKHSAQLVTR